MSKGGFIAPHAHPHVVMNGIEQQLAAEVVQIQSDLQLALLKASKGMADAHHRDIEGDPTVKARLERFQRNSMLAVGADLLLAKLYKELK